jgi:hypothetical protein
VLNPSVSVSRRRFLLLAGWWHSFLFGRSFSKKKQKRKNQKNNKAPEKAKNNTNPRKSKKRNKPQKNSLHVLSAPLFRSFRSFGIGFVCVGQKKRYSQKKVNCLFVLLLSARTLVLVPHTSPMTREKRKRFLRQVHHHRVLDAIGCFFCVAQMA